VLQGSANRRFVRLESAHTLARPEIEALLCAALANARVPMPKTGRGRVIIRRREAAAKAKGAEDDIDCSQRLLPAWGPNVNYRP
jgi:hypothetical protein